MCRLRSADGNTVTDNVTITVIAATIVAISGVAEIDDIGIEIGTAYTATLPEATGGVMLTYTATDTGANRTFPRSFLMMAHLPSLASYVVMVEWDGDKRFGHANADIFPDVDRQSAMRASRGRNYGSQIYGRSIAGTLETRLLNYHGRYDKDSTTSPLAGLIVPRRRIIWAAAAGSVVYRLWTGFLARIDKIDKTGGDDIIALLTRDDDTSIPYAASTTTGDTADAIVKTGNVDDDDLDDLEGSTTLTHFCQGKASTWRQLQAAEEAEGG